MNTRLLLLVLLGFFLGCIPARSELYLQHNNVLLKPKHAPDKCLDLNEQTGALGIWDCHSRPNQLFTFAEMGRTEIKVKGACVAFNGPAGGPTGHVPCAANQIQTQWDHLHGGVFRRTGTNLCIDVSGAGKQNGTPVIVYQCTYANNQRFTVAKARPPGPPPPPPPPPPEPGAKLNVELLPQHARNMCVDFEANTRLVINRCNGSRTQKFTYGPGNSFWIRDGIKGCLGIVSGSTIGSQYCHSSSRNVKWELRNDGSFRNIGTNLCMDVVANRTSNGSQVAGYRCHGGANQRFVLNMKVILLPPKPPADDPAPPPSNPPAPQPAPQDVQGRAIVPGHARGMCVDVNQANDRVILWQCHGGANQKFDLRRLNRGIIRSGNKCLQVDAANRETVFVGNCGGQFASNWTRTFAGELANRGLPGLCLTAAGAGKTNGTALTMTACQGKPHQRFSPN